jgi:glutamate mutase epsilon subunit
MGKGTDHNLTTIFHAWLGHRPDDGDTKNLRNVSTSTRLRGGAMSQKAVIFIGVTIRTWKRTSLSHSKDAVTGPCS